MLESRFTREKQSSNVRWNGDYLRVRVFFVEDDSVSSEVDGAGVGVSGSRGAGGGVVIMVQPIHPEITSTRSTKSKTGMPIAHCCQPASCRPGMNGEKNATR